MDSHTRILSIEQDNVDGMIVTFSDRTVAGYVVEELLELRPMREQVKEVAPSITAQASNTE
jgi:hypothetical protein